MTQFYYGEQGSIGIFRVGLSFPLDAIAGRKSDDAAASSGRAGQPLTGQTQVGPKPGRRSGCCRSSIGGCCGNTSSTAAQRPACLPPPHPPRRLRLCGQPGSARPAPSVCPSVRRPGRLTQLRSERPGRTDTCSSKDTL